MERFKYHFEPKKGWMNDPNGLCEFNGEYHFFFQHYPYDTRWGQMHWGHAVTKDFIHYEELPIALYPDMPYEDDGGCFSGSAIEKEGKLYLFYTSVSHELGQTQSVAISEDGRTFIKYEGNPVINHYPEGEATADFRDPKVIKYGDEYRMVVGTRYNGNGRALIYKSADLLKWDYVGVLFEDNEYHEPIECPDLFKLGDKWILMYSKIGVDEYATEFREGSFDGSVFTCDRVHRVEAGPQIYAPQTFEDSRGRRIFVGWFYDWKRQLDDGAYSAGALSSPREVTLEDGRLKLYPVSELRDRLESSNRMNIPGIMIESGRDFVRVTNTRNGQTRNVEIQAGTVEILQDVKAVEVFINHGEKSISMWR